MHDPTGERDRQVWSTPYRRNGDPGAGFMLGGSFFAAWAKIFWGLFRLLILPIWLPFHFRSKKKKEEEHAEFVDYCLEIGVSNPSDMVDVWIQKRHPKRKDAPWELYDIFLKILESRSGINRV